MCCKKERIWKSWRGDLPDIVPTIQNEPEEKAPAVSEKKIYTKINLGNNGAK
jgi:hypothetical protein